MKETNNLELEINFYSLILYFISAQDQRKDKKSIKKEKNSFEKEIFMKK